MKKQITHMAIVAIGFMALAGNVNAQNAKVFPDPDKISGQAIQAPPSPMALASMKKGDAYVKVVYSQPHLKGRKVLGEQEQFGKVWRLGANNATEITTTKDITINGKKLSAGTYSMYAIPNEKSWTIIFNKSLGDWGAYSYDQSKDVMRVDVPVEKAQKTYEPFTIWFDKQGSKMMMAWGDTQVSVPITV